MCTKNAIWDCQKRNLSYLKALFGLVKYANWPGQIRELGTVKSVNWDVQKHELILKSVIWH
jgi:hypothetical protein